jgi:hypothetical protein
MLSKGSGVHSLCVPPVIEKWKNYRIMSSCNSQRTFELKGGGAVYTVHTMGKKTAPENQIHCFDGKVSCS